MGYRLERGEPVGLVRPALGRTYEAENVRFRDSARELSELRDATSAIETCEALAERYRQDVPGDVFEPLRDELLARREDLAEKRDLEAALERCRGSMEAARDRIGSWKLDREGFDAIGGGLRKTFKRARKAMQRARRENSTERLHEWRKRVKYDRYHVRLLRETWRAVLDPWREQLHDPAGRTAGPGLSGRRRPAGREARPLHRSPSRLLGGEPIAGCGASHPGRCRPRCVVTIATDTPLRRRCGGWRSKQWRGEET